MLMNSFKRYWKSLPTAVRKPLVLIVGTIIVIAGLILLPLPGPGWLIIFLGFAVLATEFVIAEKVRDWLVDLLKSLLNKSKNAFQKIRPRAK